jgi:glycosyltransferase involved in cell wall biosynthesis
MKIVLLSFLYEPEIGGGAAMVVHQLAHALVGQSHNVTVLTTWKGKTVKREFVDGINIIRIPPLNLYWVADKDRQAPSKKIFWQIVDLWNPLVYRLVRQILIEEQPDVVHTHKLRGLSPSIWSAATNTGVKTIIHTCHDYELLSPEGYFMGRVGKLAREQNLAVRPYQILRQGFSRLLTGATAPSRYVMDFHRHMGFFPRAKIQIVPNTHGYGSKELAQIRSENSMRQKPERGRRFLFLGRLVHAKGIDLLCQAFAHPAVQCQESVLMIAGWGPLENSLRESFFAHGNIQFCGQVSGAQKSKLLNDSDVLVVPSIFAEPFGIVVTEAYAHGLPVISSNTGAFPELVDEGKTGFLIPPGSVDALVTTITKINQEPELIDTLAGNCFLEAQRYTLEKFTGSYLSLYGERP